MAPTAVYAATEDWGVAGRSIGGDLVKRIERAARELAWSISVREPAIRPDRFAEPTPFGDLLRSTGASDG